MKNKLKAVAFVTAFFLSFLQVNAQTAGCTDPQAGNYDPAATVNDGSCVYPSTSVNPQVVVPGISSTVSETSGLIYFNSRLWTHNDSGSNPELYQIDTTDGSVIQTIAISNANNIDWEDIAADDDFIYIGDFGNNAGNRTDLKILRLDKSSIPATSDTSLEVGTISFHFSDQTDFTPAQNNNDFDCEALISFGDSLYLFSKNWVDNKTRLYSLPNLPGNHTAMLRDSFDVNGMITAAGVNTAGNEITLLGYTNIYQPFMWLLFDFQGSSFFSGNKRRIDFNGLNFVQAEGLAYYDTSDFYFSC